MNRFLTSLFVIGAWLSLGTPVRAQNLANYGFRCFPGVSAPSSFAPGKCTNPDNSHTCFGIYCPSTGPYANTFVFSDSSGVLHPYIPPPVTNQAGKVLSTDGTVLLWATPSSGPVASITWVQGQQTWTQIVAAINAANTAGAYAVVYLDNFATGDPFTIDAAADLRQATIIGTEPIARNTVQFSAGASLTTPYLRLVNVDATVSTTLVNDEVGTDLTLFLDNTRFVTDGVATAFKVLDATVLVRNGSVFGFAGSPTIELPQGRDANVTVLSQSLFDPTTVQKASGASFISLNVTADSSDTVSTGTTAGVTLNLFTSGDAFLQSYNTRSGSWPDGIPASTGEALDKLSSRSSGGTSGLPTVYFPGLSGAGVNSLANGGLFWPSPSGVGVNLGTRFCYEGWFDYRDSGSVYILSDGAGGAHALLWDGVGGNVFLDDGSNVSFGGDDPPPPNVFSFLRVSGVDDALGAHYIVASINGIPVGRALIPAGRQRATQPTAGGYLYIGGSDHQNAQFYMAWLEAWDQYNPWFQAASGPNYVSAFVPPRWPRQTVVRTSDGVSIPVDLLLDATKATAASIPDLSLGYGPGTAPKIKHDAYFWTVPGGRTIVSGGSITDPNPDLPLPTVVYRTGTPLDSVNPYPGAPDRGLTPPATPSGAKIFDSFSRADQDLAHVKIPTLGSTESGSLGPKTWQYGCIATPTMRPSQWGIFNGRAVSFTTDYSCIAYVASNSADADILTDRRKGSWGDGATGLSFRVQDPQNFWYSHYTCNSGNAELDTGYYLAGNRTNKSSVAIPCTTAWTTLEIVTSGNTITVKVDGVVQATITDSTFSTATNFGLAGASAYDVGGSLGLWRADNFTVK